MTSSMTVDDDWVLTPAQWFYHDPECMFDGMNTVYEYTQRDSKPSGDSESGLLPGTRPYTSSASCLCVLNRIAEAKVLAEEAKKAEREKEEEEEKVQFCAICHETDAPSAFITIPCGHFFHQTCVDRWIAEAKTPHCPYCRKSLRYKKCHHSFDPVFFDPGTVLPANEMDGSCLACHPSGFMRDFPLQGERARWALLEGLSSGPPSLASGRNLEWVDGIMEDEDDYSDEYAEYERRLPRTVDAYPRVSAPRHAHNVNRPSSAQPPPIVVSSQSPGLTGGLNAASHRASSSSSDHAGDQNRADSQQPSEGSEGAPVRARQTSQMTGIPTLPYMGLLHGHSIQEGTQDGPNIEQGIGSGAYQVEFLAMVANAQRLRAHRDNHPQDQPDNQQPTAAESSSPSPREHVTATETGIHAAASPATANTQRRAPSNNRQPAGGEGEGSRASGAPGPNPPPTMGPLYGYPAYTSQARRPPRPAPALDPNRLHGTYYFTRNRARFNVLRALDDRRLSLTNRNNLDWSAYAHTRKRIAKLVGLMDTQRAKVWHRNLANCLEHTRKLLEQLREAKKAYDNNNNNNEKAKSDDTEEQKKKKKVEREARDRNRQYRLRALVFEFGESLDDAASAMVSFFGLPEMQEAKRAMRRRLQAPEPETKWDSEPGKAVGRRLSF